MKNIQIVHYCLLGSLIIIITLSCTKLFQTDEKNISIKNSINSKWIYTLRSKLAVEVVGDGEHTVMFVHGLGLTRNSWRQVANILSVMGVRSIIWDISGHGESSRLTDTVSSEGHAKDLIEIANFFKLKQYIVVGHSYGGLIAQQAAVLDNHRIDKLGLVSSWTGKLPDDIAEKLKKRFQFAMYIAPFIRLLPQKLLPAYVYTFYQSPKLHDEKDLQACLHWNHNNQNVNIQKVAIFHGKNDYTIPSEIARKSAKILNGQYIEIDTIAHQLPQTHPLEMANFVYKYLISQP